MTYNVKCLKPVKHDWCYKWSHLLNGTLREGVKGPLTQPMIAVPFPCIFQDDSHHCECAPLKKCYSGRGIPDPWLEYLTVEHGADNPMEFPKRDLEITRCLGKNYRLDFGQGIPDPWRKWVELKPMKNDCPVYGTDRICCPNCKRQLLVFCLNKLGRKRKKNATEEEKLESKVEETTEENGQMEDIPEEKIVMKDACVETEEMKDEMIQSCKCSNLKSSECSIMQKWECPCHLVKKKFCKCVESPNRECNCMCKTHSRSKKANEGNTPVCIYNFMPYLPRVPTNSQVFCNQEQGKSTSFTGNPHRNSPSFLPSSSYLIANSSQYQPQSEYYPWFPPGFPGCGSTNSHFLELKWICPKCERRRRKKKKLERKHILEEVRSHACFCDRRKKNSFSEFDDDGDSDPSNSENRKCHKRNRGTCHCDEGTSNRAEGRGLMQLLRMLECTHLYENKNNTHNKRPADNTNTDYVRKVTNAYTSMASSPKPSFSHWKTVADRQGFVPTRNNEKNDGTNINNDRQSVTFQKYTSKPVFSVDKWRNANVDVRKHKRQLNNKEMNDFKSKFDTNWLDGK